MKTLRLNVHCVGVSPNTLGPTHLTVTLSPGLRDRIRFLANLVRSTGVRGVYESNRDPHWRREFSDPEVTPKARIVQGVMLYVEADQFYWNGYLIADGQTYDSDGYPIPGEND